MIEGGEDVTIARRMLILSSEDIGANPTAFIMANTLFKQWLL
jgi:replication-associated recombination protein RarA